MEKLTGVNVLRRFEKISKGYYEPGGRGAHSAHESGCFHSLLLNAPSQGSRPDRRWLRERFLEV